MRRNRPQTSSMFLVYIQGTEFNFMDGWRFTDFSGIKDETRMIPYLDPFRHREFEIPTIRKYQPVMLAMPYNAAQHDKIFTSWNTYENQPLEIIIEPVQCGNISNEDVSLGYIHRLTGAIWNKCETVNVARSENNIVKLEIGFTFTKAEETAI